MKKLSISFIWHMHQPAYKDISSGEYLMPWVRLHAIKDYLDMLLILKDYPKIKQTFNLSPLLIDQLNDYGYNNVHDSYSKLTEKSIASLSFDDKVFILNNFFDANYENMISTNKHFKILQEKRYSNSNITVDDFSEQEYSDILALFNLVWFDSMWLELRPELKTLYDKGCNYTIEDRKFIIEIQREIIRSIIPKYKEFVQNGSIEVTASPYYHPLTPILLDSEIARVKNKDIQLPENSFKYIDDAKFQTKKALDKFNDIFGDNSYGMWPPGHCVSNESLELMAKTGVKWTISDEGILSKTIQKEFIRNFNRDLEYPYHLCKLYQANINNEKIFILFRNSVLSDLINFEYASQGSSFAAEDFYERIKDIQDKLQNTPEEHHIVTIALDGENCWENYKNDGKDFLHKLYKLLSEDETLDVTTVTDFIKKVKNPAILDKIYPSSWLNSDFKLWIGELTKNIAWDLLYKTREDLINFTYEEKFPDEIIEKAWEEIYISQDSDWFWWYGEPNDSGHDEIFDKLFRMHLQAVYKILGKAVPDYLFSPIEAYTGKCSRSPEANLTPVITGKINSEDDWKNAGCVEIISGPIFQQDKILKRVLFGNDKENIYLRFHILNDEILQGLSEIFVYFLSSEHFEALSPMRLRNKGNVIPQAQKYSYSFELELSFNAGKLRHPILSKAIDYGLWRTQKSQNIIYAFKDVVEVAIPFSELEIKNGQEVNFVITTSKYEILQEIIPTNKLLFLRRPI